MRVTHNGVVHVFASRQFRITVDDLLKRARSGDERAVETLRLIAAEITVLRRLADEPGEDSPDLKQVRQSRRFPVWRLSHPYLADYAVRTIVWFTPTGQVVVALFASDKARMGDVFYDTVGERADQIIDEWLRDHPDNPNPEERS